MVGSRLGIAVELETKLLSIGYWITFGVKFFDGEEIFARTCQVGQPFLLIFAYLQDEGGGVGTIAAGQDEGEGTRFELPMFEQDAGLNIHTNHKILAFK